MHVYIVLHKLSLFLFQVNLYCRLGDILSTLCSFDYFI